MQEMEGGRGVEKKEHKDYDMKKTTGAHTDDGETYRDQTELQYIEQKSDGDNHILVKTLTGKTIVAGTIAGEFIRDVENNIGEKTGTAKVMNEASLTHKAKQLDKDAKTDDYNIQKEDAIHVHFRMKSGTINPE